MGKQASLLGPEWTEPYAASDLDPPPWEITVCASKAENGCTVCAATAELGACLGCGCIICHACEADGRACWCGIF